MKECNHKERILVKKPKAVLKSYSALTLLANILIAISGVGFSLLGVITEMDMAYIFSIMTVLSIFGFVGRFIQQDISDVESDGPVGFKGVTIRFVWFLKRLAKDSYQRVRSMVLGFFGKDVE